MLRTWLKCFTPARQSKQQKLRAKNVRRARAKSQLLLERLEEREMPSAVSWIGGASGYWDNPANWSGNAVPTPAAQVSINTATQATITVQGGDAESINSLTIGGNDTLSIAGGSINVAANSTNGGTMTVSGGAATFAAGLANTGAITIAAGQNLTVAGAYTQAANATLSMPSNGVPTGPTTNMLADGDFESPANGGNGTTKPTGWTDWGTIYISNQYAYTGSQSVLSSGSNELVQTFSATPGATYTASVDAMMPSSAPLTGSEAAYLQVEFFDASGHAAGQAILPPMPLRH